MVDLALVAVVLASVGGSLVVGYLIGRVLTARMLELEFRVSRAFDPVSAGPDR